MINVKIVNNEIMLDRKFCVLSVYVYLDYFAIIEFFISVFVN